MYFYFKPHVRMTR